MNERSIFLAALEIENAADRQRFLDEQCAGNPNAKRNIESLLAAHTAPGSFLQSPVLDAEGSIFSADARTNTLAGAAAMQPFTKLDDLLTPSDYPGAIGRLGHYEILEIIGRGGFGIVLRAFDAKLHRVVALKLMAREYADSPAARKRFIREAKAAAAVTHDNVVAIHGVEDASSVPYLVMHFVSGCSLDQKIKREGSLEVKEILRIGLQIANGLAAAHRQGLVHRDIKPPNILLENGVQRVKITDFGLARTVDDASLTQSGVISGTPQYMSPEQAEGKQVDHRSDLFSLGSVLYAMCTGRPPFRADSTIATIRRVCDQQPRPIRELNPDIPDWLEAIIARLHCKGPNDRFQSAKEVAELLEQCLSDLQQDKRVPAVAAELVGMQNSASLEQPSDKSGSKSGLFLVSTLSVLTIGGIIQVVLIAGWLTRGKLFTWAAGAGGIALTCLFAYFIFHFGLYIREQQRKFMSPDKSRPNPWLLACGWILAAGIVIYAVVITIDKFPQFAQMFLYHKIHLKLPDTETIVEVQKTDDQKESDSRMSFKREWPFDPAALVANVREKTIRLAPGNYWLFAKQNGETIQTKLLKIGWGGERSIVIEPKTPIVRQGVICFNFANHKYSDKVTKFGVVVQVVNLKTKKQSRETIKPSQQISTTYEPGEYSLEISEAGELELSKVRVTVKSDQTEDVVVRPKTQKTSKRIVKPRSFPQPNLAYAETAPTAIHSSSQRCRLDNAMKRSADAVLTFAWVM